MPDPPRSRLQKILSDHGIASRRESERIILDGRVTVNGALAELGQSAMPGVDAIAVDGVPVAPKTGRIYVMLNKPRGYVTTMSDEKGRKTVSLLVSGLNARVYPVGRLDLDSEGLLLMTNDGEFAHRAMHPSHNIEKTYEVRVRGDAAAAAGKLRGTMTIDKRQVRARSVRIKSGGMGGATLLITVKEGRNRQIRRMCSECGLEVVSLKRVSLGSLGLGGLKTGKWRHLTDEEVAGLMG